MTKYLLTFFSLSALLNMTVLLAKEEPYIFEDREQQIRFDSLLEELRCLVCQNQSLADSGAGLADDLRRETYRMVLTGATDEEIKIFMVERYGDFVLYDPPLRASTFLLWFGPVFLILIAAIVIMMIVKQRKK